MIGNPRATNPADFLGLKGDQEAALRFLVGFAMLAPSSHNTQPWLFKIYHENQSISVWGNEKRALAVSDPSRRELFVSVGCAIENIKVAAEYYDLPCRVLHFPNEQDPWLAAKIEFSRLIPQAEWKDNPTHPVHEIFRRHANRSAYRETPVPETFIEAARLCGQEGIRVDFITDVAEREQVVTIVGDATEFAFTDPEFKKELASWMRPSARTHKDGMPGYNLGIPWLLSFIVPHLIAGGNVAKRQRAMVEGWAKATPAFGVISSTGNESVDHVRAGETLERIWLLAGLAGLKMGVLAAPIEMDDYYRKLEALIRKSESEPPARPQVFFRVGYSDAIPKFSPRLNVNDVLKQ